MTKQIRAAIFASGNGSNMQAFLDAKRLACEVVLLVCDQPDAYVIERAKRYVVPTFVLSPHETENKQVYERAMIKELHAHGVEWIILAGYMRLIGPDLLHAYEGKIVNIHPSLLPSFKGLHAVEQAMAAGVRVTGVTIHYVDEGMDTGPIIAQEAVTIEQTDTVDDLKRKIHAVEHRLYPETVNRILQNEKRIIE